MGLNFFIIWVSSLISTDGQFIINILIEYFKVLLGSFVNEKYENLLKFHNTNLEKFINLKNNLKIFFVYKKTQNLTFSFLKRKLTEQK